MNHPASLKVDKATFYRFIATVPGNERYEYVRGRIVQQQAGGTFRHSRITARVMEILTRELDRTRWAVSAERGVETQQSIRFADVVVETVDSDPDGLAAAVPRLIVEVLSPTSSDRDLIQKPGEYVSLPSLEAYVIASQTEAVCIAWVRGSDGRFPDEPRTVQGDGALIAVPALGLAIPVADIYRGIL